MSSPLFTDASGNTFVRHPSGQSTRYILDDFTDPWKPLHTREAVLIQHGFGRTAEHWYHWVPLLARHYRVVRRDLRGHGLSSFPPATALRPIGTDEQGRKDDDGSAASGGGYDYSLETILDEVVDTLDQLGIEKVHFLGESTSGMLGEALAATHPHRLLSLVICSSPTHLPQAALDLFAFGHSSWPEACRRLGSRGWAEALSRVPGTVASSDPAYVAWWIDKVAQSDGEGLAQYADFLSRLDARPFLPRIRVPMLILAPKHSAVIKVPDMEALAGQVDGAAVEVIDVPGHEIFVTGAEQCQKAISKFWQSIGRT